MTISYYSNYSLWAVEISISYASKILINRAAKLSPGSVKGPPKNNRVRDLIIVSYSRAIGDRKQNLSRHSDLELILYKPLF